MMVPKIGKPSEKLQKSLDETLGSIDWRTFISVLPFAMFSTASELIDSANSENVGLDGKSIWTASASLIALRQALIHAGITEDLAHRKSRHDLDLGPSGSMAVKNTIRPHKPINMVGECDFRTECGGDLVCTAGEDEVTGACTYKAYTRFISNNEVAEYMKLLLDKSDLTALTSLIDGTCFYSSAAMLINGTDTATIQQAEAVKLKVLELGTDIWDYVQPLWHNFVLIMYDGLQDSHVVDEIGKTRLFAIQNLEVQLSETGMRTYYEVAYADEIIVKTFCRVFSATCVIKSKTDVNVVSAPIRQSVDNVNFRPDCSLLFYRNGLHYVPLVCASESLRYMPIVYMMVSQARDKYISDSLIDSGKRSMARMLRICRT